MFYTLYIYIYIECTLKVILYADRSWNLLSSRTWLEWSSLLLQSGALDGTSKHSPSRTPAGRVFSGHATKACHVTVGQRLPSLESLFFWRARKALGAVCDWCLVKSMAEQRRDEDKSRSEQLERLNDLSLPPEIDTGVLKMVAVFALTTVPIRQSYYTGTLCPFKVSNLR